MALLQGCQLLPVSLAYTYLSILLGGLLGEVLHLPCLLVHYSALHGHHQPLEQAGTVKAVLLVQLVPLGSSSSK